MSTVDTTHTTAVAAVQQLQDDHDRLLVLLGDVLAGHTQTSRDDVALIQVYAEVLAAIRAAAETQCAACGKTMYRVTGCGMCSRDAGRGRAS